MLDRSRLKRCLDNEMIRFNDMHRSSREIYETGRRCLMYGVPMNWMQMWPGGCPITVQEARDAEIIDVDGNRYADFCLGYSAALNGHAPEKVLEAVQEQMKKGSVYTLPSYNAYGTGEKLAERFGLPVWGYALSATDANRFALRICREVTGRRKILVFNGCYHGTVSECFIAGEAGKAVTRVGNMGPAFETPQTSDVVEFNDVAGLEKILKTGDIACLLMEPVMTNIGIIHPAEGFLAACRELTQETGTIWIIDEAHTITSGPAGYTGAAGLQPDMIVLGKSIAGGIPAGCFGMTDEIAARLYGKTRPEYADTSGIGGTMTGSPLAMAAIAATLDHHLTQEGFSKSIPKAEEFTDGICRVIEKYSLPFCTNQAGARAEYVFSSVPARNASESISFADHELYEYFFVGSLNRGFIMSPYYNIMAVFSPVTRVSDVRRHSEVFEELVRNII